MSFKHTYESSRGAPGEKLAARLHYCHIPSTLCEMRVLKERLKYIATFSRSDNKDETSLKFCSYTKPASRDIWVHAPGANKNQGCADLEELEVHP